MTYSSSTTQFTSSTLQASHDVGETDSLTDLILGPGLRTQTLSSDMNHGGRKSRQAVKPRSLVQGKFQILEQSLVTDPITPLAYLTYFHPARSNLLLEM